MSDFDPTDLDGQEDAATAKQATAADELRNEINDLKWLVGNKRGRRIVWRLLEQARVHHPSYDPSSALATAFNEGQRNQGLRLMAQIMAHCSEDYVAMLQERLPCPKR